MSALRPSEGLALTAVVVIGLTPILSTIALAWFLMLRSWL